MNAHNRNANKVVMIMAMCLLATALVANLAMGQPSNQNQGAAFQNLPMAAPQQVGLSAERLAEIAPFVQKYIDAKEMSGAVTIIARRGKVVHFEAHGLMDVKANKPMQKDTIFRIYSMTKPVVAMAVMKLYEQGKLDLNDPISKYIPAMKNLKVGPQRAELERQVTIHDLLSHTAGLTGDEGGGRTSLEVKKPDLFG